MRFEERFPLGRVIALWRMRMKVHDQLAWKLVKKKKKKTTKGWGKKYLRLHE